MPKGEVTPELNEQSEEFSDKPTCGLVMPISAIDGCDEMHWKDVMSIFSASIKMAGFEPNLVSNDTDVGVIHKRIVQNLYNNPIVVCDVSGKNPNVMFELGMRLAFDKPVIIVKDDKTPYSFDTSPVEHLTYPRDLRFGTIVEFQAQLTEKIRSAKHGGNSFLASFGTFKVAQIKEESASALDIILEELGTLKRDVRRQNDRFYLDERMARDRLVSDSISKFGSSRSDLAIKIDIRIQGLQSQMDKFVSELRETPHVKIVGRRKVSTSTEALTILNSGKVEKDAVFARLSFIARDSGIENMEILE